MSRLPCSIYLVLCLLVAACGERPVDPSATGSDTSTPEAGSGPADNSGTTDDSASTDAVVVDLSPSNTQIQFVGTHAGDDPNPRTGVFTEFEGNAEVDAEASSLKSVTVDIKVDSLLTPFEKLTNHLKSPDFFDRREYPSAKFESTSIASDGNGDDPTITGNLTLMGTTREISFPAEVSVSGDEVTLHGTVTINRSEYGMDKLLDRVEDPVEITVDIGKPTTPPTDGNGE